MFATYSEAQGFLTGTGWASTPWSTDGRYVAFASAIKLGRGIKEIRLATGAQVYKAWVRVWHKAETWTAEGAAINTTAAF
jgi:hypothetical protein